MANKLLDAAIEVVRVRDILIIDDVRVPMALSLAIDRLRDAAESPDRTPRLNCDYLAGTGIIVP